MRFTGSFPVKTELGRTLGPSPFPEVVELPLLLPKDWAVELINLAKSRQQSVAGLLRDLVGQAIREKASQFNANEC